MFFSCKLTACRSRARRSAYFCASEASSGSGFGAPSPYAARASARSFSSVVSSSVSTRRRTSSRDFCVSASTLGNPAGLGVALPPGRPVSSPTQDSFFQPFSGATLLYATLPPESMYLQISASAVAANTSSMHGPAARAHHRAVGDLQEKAMATQCIKNPHPPRRIARWDHGRHVLRERRRLQAVVHLELDRMSRH